jgi:hypothetical protein
MKSRQAFTEQWVATRAGRNVEATGLDPEAVIEKCWEAALEIMANIRSPKASSQKVRRRCKQQLAIGREAELICVDGTNVSLVKDRNGD